MSRSVLRLVLAVALATAALGGSATPVAAGQPDKGAPTPTPTPPPDGDDDPADATPPEPEPDALDVTALRQEYLALRDQLFRSRARAAAVAGELYSTKLVIDLTYTTGRFYTITRATVRLDGANVYDDTDGAIAKDAAPRFTGFVAPGRHVVNVRIEAVGKDDDRFTSVIDNTFTVQAPAGKDVKLVAKARDGGDIPYSWSREENGTYSLVLDVNVTSAKRAAAAAKTSMTRPSAAKVEHVAGR